MGNKQYSLGAGPAPSWLFIATLAVASIVTPTLYAAEPTAADLDFFEKEVRPILAANCYECHGPNKQQADLRLDHISTIIPHKWGNMPIVTPGDVENSYLVKKINYTVEKPMPPKSKLPDGQIATLTEWIKRGAPWPDEPAPEAAKDTEVFDLQARKKSHWAWQPVVDHPSPKVKDQSWATNDIDPFILVQLEANGLSPAKSAERATLIRRVYFDIIGLPPTTEQVKAFVEDKSPKAFENVVDELLASQHFGERWGRHWLDLARYAETYGHEFDYPIYHAWQYRDYVIRAFNEDVPYDKFVVEHIAGDLMENPRRHPEKQFNESIIATGFWWLSQGKHAPVDVRLEESDRFENQIDVMSKTFLGMTVACARCHDHKFDAIATKDYYALAGFLQSSRSQWTFIDIDGKIAESRGKSEEAYAAGQDAVRGMAQGSPAALTNDIAAYLSAAQAVLNDPNYVPTGDKGFVIEGEDLQNAAKASAGTLEIQNDGRWANNSQLWWRDAKPGDTLVLTFNAPKAGRFEVGIVYTTADDYGTAQIQVNGQSIGRPIDMFTRNLEVRRIPTLGKVDLVEGANTLTIKIDEANKEAKPRNMVGLDQLLLRRVAATDDDGDTPVSRIARERKLDEGRLAKWADALGQDTIKNPAHPLFAWNEMAKPEHHRTADLFARHRDRVEGDLTKRASDARNARNNAPIFETFDKPEALNNWFVTGHAFENQTSQPGDWNPASPTTSIITDGIADTRRFGNRFQGVLRSQTFELQGPVVHLRIAGKDGQVRIIIDGYTMDVFNGLLFGGISPKINNEKFKWVTIGGDLRMYQGHRAHIEIKDEGDGWIAVDEIQFGNRPVESFDNAVAVESLSSAGVENMDDLAKSYGKTLATITQKHRGDKAITAPEAEALNWLLENGLLPVNESVAKELSEARSALHQAANSAPHPQRAIAMADGTGENEFIYIRGNHKTLGDEAPRQFLTALMPDKTVNYGPRSGRLVLAEQIIDESNPLVGRVMANRVWHHLFGRGIVPTTDDFGVLGKRPTHPELLDHLAHWYRHDGQWSTKKLIKYIVMSKTYQMSSKPEDAKAEEQDPSNNLLHRQRVRRLEGEVIRDAILHVSGRFNDQMYGDPVRIHLTPFMTGRGHPGGSGPLDGDGRRSIYTAVRRNFLWPMMLAFDSPVPFTTIGNRTVSNVPAQALILMNDPLIVQEANRWAKSVLASKDKVPEQRITEMYLTAFAQEPTREEITTGIAFLREQAAAYGAPEDAWIDHEQAWSDFAHALFNVKRFIFIN